MPYFFLPNMCSVLNHPFNPPPPISLDPRNNHTAGQIESHTTGFPKESGRWWQGEYTANFVYGQSDLHFQNKKFKRHLPHGRKVPSGVW